MSHAFAHRNLLFGVLAWKLGWISADQLSAAMSSWTVDKSRSVGDILIEQGALPDERREPLESLVDVHIKAHQYNAQASFASIGPLDAVGEQLQRLNDAELATLLLPVAAPLGEMAGDVSTQILGGSADTVVLAGAHTSPEASSGSLGTRDSSWRRFVVLREHAQGGLGKVSLARDEELNREVALKEIRPSRADDAASRRRFVREAEITGGLEHPGLAPVYGMGTFPDGRPFYAMRFIRGESLNEAIRRFHEPRATAGEQAVVRARESQQSLELRRLLGRFTYVCQTVHYAHSRGVLHRDLKPANIMLGHYGETLVVDWGLAKALGERCDSLDQRERGDPARTDIEPPLRPRVDQSDDELGTRHGAVVGTPAYMSPEQAAACDTISPASDIYSLGATLYCLLTGQVPVREKSSQETIRRVLRGDFAPPRRLNPAVPRPLEAICLKAMALAPSERYATAVDLADDIERFLADEPVSAWREPLGTRARRWIRKHRAVASSTAASVLVALVALLCSLFFVSGLNRELSAVNAHLVVANAAERQARQSTRETLSTMTDDIEQLLSQQVQWGDNERAFLHKLQGYYEAFAKSQGDSADARHDRADGLRRVGNVRWRLGQLVEAEAAYREALLERQKLAADFPDVPEYRYDLARVYNNLGLVLTHTDRSREAEQALREALNVGRQLVADFPAQPTYRQLLAMSHNQLGILLAGSSRRVDAEAAYRQALSVQQALAAEFPSVNDYRQDLARSQHNLGILLADLNRPQEAEAMLRDAAAGHEKLAAECPTIRAYLEDLARSRNALGVVLATAGRSQEAAAVYRHALAMQQKLVADFPTAPAYRDDLALTFSNLGNLLIATDQLRETEAAYREAVAVRRKLAADYGSVAVYRERLAASQSCLGDLLALMGRPKEAEATYHDALDVWKQLSADFPKTTDYADAVAKALSDLAESQNNKRGKMLAEKANAIFRSQTGPTHGVRSQGGPVSGGAGAPVQDPRNQAGPANAPGEPPGGPSTARVFPKTRPQEPAGTFDDAIPDDK